jgi:hypothetical protein
MILLEILRQSAEIYCRQCQRDECATGQTLPAKLILAVHNLSLFVDIRVETFSPVVQYALRNVLMQMQNSSLISTTLRQKYPLSL